MGLLDNIFGSHSERELKRIYPIVDKIDALETSMQSLSDEDLKNKTTEFKGRLEKGETLDDILPEAFAVVREASVRTTGLRHYRVQMIGGIILHQGRIAEMRTGEGKTLVSTLPVYLNALEGKGVHVVTVNEYLSKRDAEEMGQIYAFLGLSVGVVYADITDEGRKAAYQCDVTYVTNSELGFDYLRDNMALSKDQLVLRGLNYAIIDELDSILIDEARTPLIISGRNMKASKYFEQCDTFVRSLEKGISNDLSKLEIILKTEGEESGDYVIDEKDKYATLTAAGIRKAEEYFHVNNLADIENIDLQDTITLALRAHNFMFKDKHYIVKNGEVLIVDENTGRIMDGRRFSDGLHQAIEAKEGLTVKADGKILATITYQHFFNKYIKKCGMTGTAYTEENEFRDIYGMDVIVIPTNKPIIRIDHEDVVLRTKKEKLEAVVEDVLESNRKGQPVLIGTATIDASMELSALLKEKGINHNVLNANMHEYEAEIVAQAGQRGVVTVATNMAGRGTDIKLGDGVAELGGLKIIGTERHESRRIDHQLRGRAGRQGDPGESCFYLSLEDDLLRIFGSEKLIEMFNTMKISTGTPLKHKFLTSMIEKAQKKVEENNYGTRKTLLDFDEVNNEHRELIYKERMQVLNGECIQGVIQKMMKDTIRNIADKYIADNTKPEDWPLNDLVGQITAVIPIQKLSIGKNTTKEEFIQQIQDIAEKIYQVKEYAFATMGYDMKDMERMILLKVVDVKWTEHINNMEQLRIGIGLEALGQKNPVTEFRFKGYNLFNEMSESISEETIKSLLSLRTVSKNSIAPADSTQDLHQEGISQVPME